MGGRKKPLLALDGRPILHHAIRRLGALPGCAEIVVALQPADASDAALAAALRALHPATALVAGGATRQQSVAAGLAALTDSAPIVLIHDAVRPLVHPDVVRRVAEAAAEHGAAVAAVPATETVKEVGEGGRVLRTPPRESLWYARTPQGFRRELLIRAHEAARSDGFSGTDDVQLAERIGADVIVVQDAYDNIKITTAEDLAIAEAILRWRAGRQGEGA